MGVVFFEYSTTAGVTFTYICAPPPPQPSMKVARTAVGAASHGRFVYAVGGECALEQPQDDETLYLR